MPVKKEPYEFLATILGSSVAITVLMSAIINASLEFIQPLSFIMIILYALCFFLTWIFGLISINKKDNKLAKITFWLTGGLIFLFLIYAIIYIKIKTGVSINITFPNTNFTPSS